MNNKRKYIRNQRHAPTMAKWYQDRNQRFKELVDEQAREYKPDFINHNERREYVVLLSVVICAVVMVGLVAWHVVPLIVEPLFNAIILTLGGR